MCAILKYNPYLPTIKGANDSTVERVLIIEKLQMSQSQECKTCLDLVSKNAPG